MDRFAAHYIFTGTEVLRKAVLASNDNYEIVSLSDNDAMAIEYSNTIFFNGILCPQIVSAPAVLPFKGTLINCDRYEYPENIPTNELYIHFPQNNKMALFRCLIGLQAVGYSLFTLLQVLTVNNCKANHTNPPLIHVGEVCRVMLLESIDLQQLKFRMDSRFRLL